MAVVGAYCLLVICVLLTPSPATTSLSSSGPFPYVVDNSSVTISGISGGAFFSVQAHIIRSAIIRGVGVVAGGPFWCAEGSFLHCVAACNLDPHLINTDKILGKIEELELSNKIDSFSNVIRNNHSIYVYSGTEDTVIPQGVGHKLVDMYRRLGVPENRLRLQFGIKSEHAFITESYGHSCEALESPFINHCHYDQAGIILKWMYPEMTFRDAVAPLPENIHKFWQSHFGAESVANHGYMYVPTSCSKLEECKFHIAFHGCAQSDVFVGTKFVEHAGYNEWAESNQIIIMYPQAAPSILNPAACWDYWGYTGDKDYITKQASQMKLVDGILREMGIHVPKY